MRGSMMERNDMPGVWRLRVYVGRTEKGKPIQVSKQFRGGKREAETALAEFLTTTQRKYGLARQDIRTVAELLDDWLAHIEPDRSLSYMREARRRVDKRLVPAIGNRRLDQLTTSEVERTYRKWLIDGLAPTTIRGLHAILLAAFHHGERHDFVRFDDNPVRKAKPPAVHAPKKSAAMTVPQIVALLVEADRTNPTLAAAIRLAILLGVRRGELCALRWTDVDLGVGKISVRRALTVIKGEITEGDTKTHQDRELVLGDGAYVVKAWRDAVEKLAAAAGAQLAADAFVLSRRADGRTPVMPDSLTQAFGRLCARLELPFHFHDLRHAMASTAVSAGLIMAAADRLGHADPSLTLRVYSHASASEDAEIANLMAAALGASPVLRNEPEPGSFS